MTEPWYEGQGVTVWRGDSLVMLPNLDAGSVDAVICDPPYGLEFMGKEWDSFGDKTARGTSGATFAKGTVGGYDGKPMPRFGKRWTQRRCATCGHTDAGGSPCSCEAPTWQVSHEPGTPRFAANFQAWCEQWARECYRLLKPGGHLLAFGGTRTWHRLAAGIEDAGFEIRDSIAYLYGSGFPKSLDVSKAIDKVAGATREVVGRQVRDYTQDRISENPSDPGMFGQGDGERLRTITAPATFAAAQWQGWGTALKPAFEPVVVARKPLVGTVAANVLAHGTGALNIDASRIRYQSGADRVRNDVKEPGLRDTRSGFGGGMRTAMQEAGRWPANVVLDESQATALDEQTAHLKGGTVVNRNLDPDALKPHSVYGHGLKNLARPDVSYGDTGGASRFFYTAKASRSERPSVDGVLHPTVKPLSLMRWLVRLVTPPNGVVLDPFAGSGTTVEAAMLEGFRCVAVEREAEYLPLIRARIDRATALLAAKRAAPSAGPMLWEDDA